MASTIDCSSNSLQESVPVTRLLVANAPRVLQLPVRGGEEAGQPSAFRMAQPTLP